MTPVEDIRHATEEEARTLDVGVGESKRRKVSRRNTELTNLVERIEQTIDDSDMGAATVVIGGDDRLPEASKWSISIRAFGRNHRDFRFNVRVIDGTTKSKLVIKREKFA